MPKLRRHRRPRDRFGRLRGRASRPVRRRNLAKFIPESDSDFALVARQFSYCILPNPSEVGLNDDDAARIAEAVNVYRLALARTTYRQTRNPQLVLAKDTARAEAEKVIRRYANIIRANPDVSKQKKDLLRLKVRPTRLGKRKCPKQAPVLMFIGTGDGVVGGIAEGSGSGVHVLKYFDEGDNTVLLPSRVYGVKRRAKPIGAARIELYFDMIPVGERVPQLPNERGWPKYLRSFTRSPIEVEFPIPSEPMLIVYWARWADSSGEVSRWSKPCIARLEGWSRTARPALEGEVSGTMEVDGRGARGAGTRIVGGRQVETKYVYIQTPIAGELPDHLPEDMSRALVDRMLADDRRPAALPCALPDDSRSV